MAGNKYLNAQEKADMLKIGAITITLDLMIENWAKSKNKKTLVKYLRTANTYINKAFQGRMMDLEAKEVKLLLKQANDQELLIAPSRDAQRKREALKKEFNTNVLSWDDFSVLVNHCLASCSVCETRDTDTIETCKFRALLMEQDVQALTLEPKTGQCQYRIVEEVSNGS